MYDYQKYQYSDEEEKRRGKILSLYYLFDSVLLLLAMIYHKRMQTLKLQKNLREIRQKKEEVSNSEFYPTSIVPLFWLQLGVKSANTKLISYETYNPSEARRETDEVRKLDFFKAKTIDYGSASYKLWYCQEKQHSIKSFNLP